MRKFSYKDSTSVSGCPITGRMNNLFGTNWDSVIFESKKNRVNVNTGEIHSITYTVEDIWHICISYDDAENVEAFALRDLQFSNEKASALVRIWGAIPQGYGQLSLKAIKKINNFLVKGLIYSDAVLLANVPGILGGKLWKDEGGKIINDLIQININNKQEKRILNIANNLISNYKSLDIDEQFANRNCDYKLDNSDYKEIEKFTVESFGEKTWNKKPLTQQNDILDRVAKMYQAFFNSSKRDYFKLPKIVDSLKQYLSDNFDLLNCKNGFFNSQTKLPCNCHACKQLNKLYHPSLIEFYKPAKEKVIEYNKVLLSKKLLDSPVIGVFKNPMAMRAMHILRQQINSLLLENIIDEETRIVIETAKDLNDANMRWAIDAYQKERERENKEISSVIQDYLCTKREISNDEVDKARLLVEQHNSPVLDGRYKKDIDKYRLWLEQGCQCMYTGNILNITNLFSDNGGVDFEHTIPRSISFDNSLANLTVCDAFYNRNIKRNQIPTQLPNYNTDFNINGVTYSAIKPRLEHWKEKVERLKDNVEFWRNKSKKAQDKEVKDYAIRQRHLWQMELDYWKNKLDRFTMQEVTSGFKNSQLVDTRIITKYAYHYFKSVFNNVDVQKGAVTAVFRKILGVQSLEEKKSRDKHSHHAIDATILTLVPTSSKRDKMIKLFYEIEEKQKLNQDVTRLLEELNKEKRSCNIGNISNVGQFIEDNILINHISKDQTLTPARQRTRIRGKIVQIENQEGELVPKWKKGDSIRGQLHGDTYYGAIKQAEKDENGKILRNSDGAIEVGSEIFFVVRRELKFKSNSQDKGFVNIKDLESKIVDKFVFNIIEKQCEGKTFKQACEDGFYMFNKQGKVVNKMRHVRCFSNQKNPLAIKKQTYLSDKLYKQNFYAEVGDLYLLCKYISKDEIEKEFIIYSLFDISENRKRNIEDIPKKILNKKMNVQLDLSIIIKVGDFVLLGKKEELRDLGERDKRKRLFIVRGFENDGKRIILKKHTSAVQDKNLGKGESVKDYNQLPEKIRCGVNTISFLLNEYDFKISINGEIIIPINGLKI